MATLKKWISDNTTAGLVVDICSAATDEHLSGFHDSGYDAVVDIYLNRLHGKQTVDPDYVEDPADGIGLVDAYLKERGRYLTQVISYVGAEYNPIENYSQTESESIETTHGEQNKHGTDTTGEDKFTHGAHDDTYQYEQYSDYNKYPEYTDTITTGDGNGYSVTTHTAKVKTTSHPGDVTDTNSVAPFDSDTFHNKEQNKRQTLEGWESVERIPQGQDQGDDKISYSTRTDKTKHGQHNDEIQHGAHDDVVKHEQYDDTAHVGGREDSYAHTEDEYKDSVERDLSRSGNIGVQTAAQMMALDEDFWWKFKPLQKIAREIAALLVEGVNAI